ncbi:hypothetical protein [Sorangium sp. So ce1335]|uniref:hypothetical protein n=1 Tax=Sorangium sp. So ce1335 TaxID=3133335 RepID=UPI003F606970
MGTFFVALLGAGAGLTAALLFARFQPPSSEPAGVPRATGEVAPPRESRAELARVNNRLALVERALEKAQAAEEELPSGEGEPEPDPGRRERQRESDEVLQARAVEQFDQSIEAFKAMPPDSTWAPRATTALTSDLHALSERVGFKVDSVECKDHQCLAQIESSSPHDAVRHVQEIAHSSHSIKCATQANVKVPEGATGAVSASVVFSHCR